MVKIRAGKVERTKVMARMTKDCPNLRRGELASLALHTNLGINWGDVLFRGRSNEDHAASVMVLFCEKSYRYLLSWGGPRRSSVTL